MGDVKRPEAPHADLIARLRMTDRRGGLGYDAHAVIKEAADALAELGDAVPREQYDALAVTAGQDARAASWNAENNGMLVDRSLRYRQERDALAHVIEQAPHAPGCRWDRIDARRGPDACTCWKSTTPAVSLALHDAEMKAQALDEVMEYLVGPYVSFAQLHTRAAALRKGGI